MKIRLASIPVTDQQHALDFYCDILGFEKKLDIDLGEYRWRTVVSPEKPAAAGGAMVAVFDDTCGNLIQLYEAGNS